MRYRFDDIEIDIERFELKRSGEVQHVEPLVFDLVRFFCERPGEVLDREQIIDAVWQRRIVSDATISSCIKLARKALGDSGSAQRFIKTVRGRGFQFDAKIEKAETTTSTIVRTKMPAGTPYLLIRDFENLSQSSDFDRLAKSLANSLTRILCRVPMLKITRREKPALDDHDHGFELELFLSDKDGQVIADVQLTEMANGFHLWARAFEQQPGQNLADRLLHDILPKLETQLVRAIFDTAKSDTGELSSRQLVLQATGILSLEGWHAKAFAKAKSLLQQSIDREPDFALSHAYLTLICGLGHRVGLFDSQDRAVDLALTHSACALDLDSHDGNVLGLVGCGLSDIGETARGIPILHNAIDFSPDNPQGWTALGAAHLANHEFDLAIEHLSHGIAISPMDKRLSVWGSVLAIAHLFTGEFEDAQKSAEYACSQDFKTYMPRVVLAAVYMAQDRADRARLAVEEASKLFPDLNPNHIFYLIGKRHGLKLTRLLQDR